LRQRLRELVYEVRNRRTFGDLYQHDRMLADRARNDAYWAALGKHLSTGDVVIDVGAGSGVLSLFAARHGARVHAAKHGPIVQVAERVARDNGVTSIEFPHPQPAAGAARAGGRDRPRADRRRALRRAGRDQHRGSARPAAQARRADPPASACPVHRARRGPRGYAGAFRVAAGAARLRFEALEALRQKQKPSYLYRSFRPFPFERFLCRPDPVVSVDLLTVRPADLPTEISCERTVESDGTLDGYCVYFDAFFDDEIGFTSSPQARATNWANPLLRVTPRRVKAGERLRFSLRARDLADPSSWEWDWR
jgi:hypothetical protein